MIRVVPDYYPAFHCIASACRHNCCVGWEIDVDADALARYRRVRGPFGDRLRDAIAGEPPHFVLTASERCPFLDDNDLCDIICRLGEDALCQICADHPRFRTWLPDRVEEGLGLCCEAAARLLLTHAGPVRFQALPCAEPEEPASPEYRAALLRRDETLRCLQDRRKPLGERICEAFSLYGERPPETEPAAELALLRGLESLEPAWRRELEALSPEELAGGTGALSPEDGEQLLVYLVFRYGLRAALEWEQPLFPLRFGQLTLRLLGALAAGPLGLEERVELVRRWSAELEYSEENLAALAEFLCR